LRTFAHETAGAASTRHSLRPLFFGRNDLQSPGETRRGKVHVCVQPSSQRMDFQGVWIDPGEMLPVISDPSSEVRQAATPKNAVSIKAATSKIIEEKWPTPWPRNQHCTQSHRTSTVCRVGKCSRADLNEVFPRRGATRLRMLTAWSGGNAGVCPRHCQQRHTARDSPMCACTSQFGASHRPGMTV
jgi:hypothetical protein